MCDLEVSAASMAATNPSPPLATLWMASNPVSDGRGVATTGQPAAKYSKNFIGNMAAV